MTPEFFPRLPVWPESQRGRFRCVHIGVNDHQPGCQQPLQCFYNGILICSPHHPAELKSSPVCLLLVRLLLKTGNKRQPLWSAYLWGAFLRYPNLSANATNLLAAGEERKHQMHWQIGEGSRSQPQHASCRPGSWSSLLSRALESTRT